MFKLVNKRLRNRKGFTLIELVVVVAILGILALIAIPRFAGVRDNAATQAARSTAVSIANAAELYYINENDEISTVTNDGDTTTDFSDLVPDYLREEPDTTNVTYTLTKIDDGLYSVSYSGDDIVDGEVGTSSP